jgi:hypothetical protein
VTPERRFRMSYRRSYSVREAWRMRKSREIHVAQQADDYQYVRISAVSSVS